MRISLPFLLAKYLRRFLLIMINHSFYSPLHRGHIRKVSVHSVQKYFPHDCSTDSLSCSEQGKSDLTKKNQNKIATRQRQDSVTVSDTLVSIIDTQKNNTGTGHRRYRE